MEAVIAFVIVITLMSLSDCDGGRKGKHRSDEIGIGRSQDGSYYVYVYATGDVLLERGSREECEAYIDRNTVK